MFFLFFKQRGTVAIPFANPARLSIFWKQNRNLLRKTTLKQSILFPKNHDIFSLIKTVNLTKTNNKQNFVRRKIAVWAFVVNFKLDKVI